MLLQVLDDGCLTDGHGRTVDEFLNRIDEIVLFRKLDQPQLEQIVRLMLGASAARLDSREVAF